MHLSKRVCAAVAALLFTGITATTSSAAVIYFQGITNNDTSGASVAAGQAQLWMNVTAPQANQVLFTFGNTGSVQSTITAIYFEKGVLNSLAQVINSGDSFAVAKKLGVLPGGNGNPISFSTAFEVDADNPSPQNGVNNGPAVGGDTVGVLFTLAAQKTYQDVLNQISAGQLRVGLHVQNFAQGNSESFITHTPEPTTAALALTALGLLRFRRRQLAE